MASKKLENQEEGSAKMKKKLENLKFPKIPIDKVYKKKPLSMFSSYAIKDFKQTLTVEATEQDLSFQLVTRDNLKGFVKKHHKFLHLGLVQIAIKPLLRDGLEAPIIVSLTDNRHLDFKNSLLAMVETNLGQGPFYFNCFPNFAVSLSDVYNSELLTLNLMTSGAPLALTYRIVCKAMVDLNSDALVEFTMGETTYYQTSSRVPSITKWDRVSVPGRWTTRKEQVEASKKEAAQMLNRMFSDMGTRTNSTKKAK